MIKDNVQFKKRRKSGVLCGNITEFGVVEDHLSLHVLYWATIATLLSMTS